MPRQHCLSFHSPLRALYLGLPMVLQGRSLQRIAVCGVAMLVAMLLGFVPSARAQGYLFGRASYSLGSTGTGAASIALGDFNGDGIGDLVIVQPGNNRVAVLLGKADGTVAPAVFYPTGNQPVAVVAADFNSDGRLDLAIANQNCTSSFECGAHGSISILLGNGDGTFQPQSIASSGIQPMSLVAGDFNSDGKVDLAAANGELNSVVVLLGNGDGTFQSPVSYRTPGGAESVALGDFNHDGNIDLAVGNSGVSIFLGKGDGTFEHSMDLLTLPGPNAVVVADFNGDGALDLAVSYGQEDAVSILLGNGDGTFQPRTDFVTARAATAMTVADLNGDGRQDVVVANSNQSLSILLGNGDGTLQPEQTFALAGVPAAVAVQDFNRDGKLDLAIVASEIGQVSIILGRGDGTFPTPQPIGGSLGAWAIVAGNFSNSGSLDLLTTSLNDNSILLFPGSGDGTFGVGASSLTGQVPVAAAVGDFNQDGRLDVAVVNQTCTSLPCANGSVSVFLGDGDGTFQPAVDYSTGSIPVALAVADLNGDGIPDLAVVNNGFGFSDTLSLLLGKGDGTFLSGGTLATPAGPTQVVAADFNHDGAVDLAVASSFGVSIIPGRGAGSFGPRTDYPIIDGAKAIATGDFNGDGKPDLAVTTINSVLVLLANGDGTFQPSVAYALDSLIDLSRILVGDFDGDGKLDLLVGKSNNAVSILIGNGDGTFQLPIDLPLGESEHGWAAGDFTGDGGIDLAAASVGPSAVFVSLNVPVVALFPAALNFGVQGQATSSSPARVTVSNPSGAPVAISGVTTSGPFSVSNGCPAMLAPGSNCALSVTFSPTAPGNGNGVLTISDNAYGGAQNVALQGVGIGEPAAVASPTSLSFATQNVGSTSAAASVTLVNSGGAAMTISSITASGDFAESDNCVPGLAAGTQCTITVTFAPSTAGVRPGVLTITDNAPSSPQTVSLSGTGAANPNVSLSASILAFGNQLVNTASSPQLLTVTNNGNAALQITSVNPTAGFSSASNCPASLSVSSSCTISVSFEPNSAGTTVGSVTLTDNALDSPQTVALTGTGTVPVAALAPSNVSFTTQVVGSAGSQSVTLTNAGSAPLTVSGVTVSGPNAVDFSLQNQCSASLAAGSSCGMVVSFAPSAAGTRSAILNIASNAGSSPQSVSLTGTGADFSLASTASSPAQMTVAPGGQAAFYLTLLPGAVQGSASFTCAGAPLEATCLVTPGTAALDGTTPVALTVSVQTTASSQSFLKSPPIVPQGGSQNFFPTVLPAVVALMGLVMMNGRRHMVWALAAITLLTVLCVGCGSGGQINKNSLPTQPGTPTGSYSLAVTATAAGRTHATTLTLTVQN